jgi:hypothetical protein
MKTESTSNEENIKKSTRKSKTTYSRRWVIGTILRDHVRDDTHSLQNFLEVLQHLFFG